MLNLAHTVRFGGWCLRRKIPLMPRLIYFVQFIIFNSAVYPSVRLGNGSRFAYGGIGVVVHSDVVIGNRVIIGQGVTIGGNLGRKGVPTIGDNVTIGAGARIFGPITVGAGSFIGANSVVTRDVPENSVVSGIPARVIGSNRA